MSDLRTRIAAALYDHWWHGTTTLREPPVWAKLSDSARDEWLRQADAVIRELKQEWLVDMGYGGLEPFDTREEAINRMAEINEDWGDDPPEAGVLLMSRYVTDWKADDE